MNLKLKKPDKVEATIWILIILFFVSLLISYLLGYLNQAIIFLGNAAFLIFGILFFILVIIVLLGILGFKIRK